MFKALLVILSYCIGFSSLFGADIAERNCTITGEITSNRISDPLGNNIDITRTIYRKCEEHYTEQGNCLEFETVTQEINTSMADQYLIGTEDYQPTQEMLSVLSVIGAVSQTRAMFSGIHGHCEEGYTQNFDWMEDPTMWASFLLSASGGGLFGDSVAKATDAFNYGYGGCLTGAALDATKLAIDYYSDDSNDCNPVDEICDQGAGEGAGVTDITMVETLAADEFNALVAENPDILNSIVIIEDGRDPNIGHNEVIFRIKSTNELIDANSLDTSTKEKLDDAEQEAKDMEYTIKASIVGAKLAACAGGEAFNDGFPSKTQNSTIDSGNSGNAVGGKISDMFGGKIGESESGMLVSAAISLLPAPYNTVGALALKFANSYTKIDSCNNEVDAQSAGKRHQMAWRGLRFNTCHFIGDEKLDKWPDGKEMRTRFNYCCYSMPISKILVVQMKAQLGRGWDNCSDISPKELKNISFRNCLPEERDGVDGRTIKRGEDMTASFQYRYQCMDLDPLTAEIKQQIGIDFGETNVHEMLERIRPDSF